MPCLHPAVHQRYSAKPLHVVRQCALCALPLEELALTAVPTTPGYEAVREAFEERAAIMEHEGGLDHVEAEQLAWESVTHQKEGDLC